MRLRRLILAVVFVYLPAILLFNFLAGYEVTALGMIALVGIGVPIVVLVAILLLPLPPK